MILSLSGPKALVLLQLLIPVITCSVVNVTADIHDFCFRSQDTSRVSREEVCLQSFDVVKLETVLGKILESRQK